MRRVRTSRRWSAPTPEDTFREAVSRRFTRTGIVDWEFARAKLRHDPVLDPHARWVTSDTAVIAELIAHTPGEDIVDRLADDVEDAAEGLGADRHDNLLAGIEYVLTTNQAVGRVHGNGPHGVFTQMLGDFQNQVPLPVVNRRVGHLKRVVDLGKLAGFKFDVDNRADDLCNASFIHDEPFLHSATRIRAGCSYIIRWKLKLLSIQRRR